MEIKLIRKYYQAKYTIGRLYVNNRFFSDCLEPPSLHRTYPLRRLKPRRMHPRVSSGLFPA